MLEVASAAGDLTASKSLACMALLREGETGPDGGGGEVVDFRPYLKLVSSRAA